MSENIKSSIFDFIWNTPKVNWSHLKYFVVNNHYPRQGNHQRPFTVMTDIFHLSEAQNNVSTRVIHFCKSPAMTGHGRVSDRNGFTTTINISPSLSTLCTSEPCIDFVFTEDHQALYNNNQTNVFIIQILCVK